MPATPAEIDATLRALRRAGYVARALGGRWILARDLDAVMLEDLAAVLGLALRPGPDWEPAAQGAVEGLAAAAEAPMRRSLSAVLGERAGKTTEEPA